MIGGLATAWAVTVLISVALDTLAKPKAAPWHHRTGRSELLHLTTVTWLFVLFFALWGRAWFALVCTVGLIGLLVAVNSAKFKALREPVVFSDLALFAQSIRHPRLYFPYLSWFQLLTVVPGVALFALAFWFDSELNQIPAFLLGLIWFSLFLIACWLAKGLDLSLNPERDQARHGFFSVFVAYLLNGLSWREIRYVKTQLHASPYANISVRTSDKSGHKKANAPDVVVVQSESFFDIRKTGLRIAPDLLTHFDFLQQSGIYSGTLEVPAWGANTMRTEHAFLSGLPNVALRYASFYPYAFVTQAAPAMPHAFQAQGYRCTAVHPYPADFFLRHKVFPRMGFDEFVDEVHFADAAHEGPYVSDAAVTDWLIRRLDQPTDQAQFLFAITMENHGPLHLEKATAIEADALYQRPNGQAIDDLTVYLRHIANANKMLGRLQDFLANRQRNTLLCFYGDHVPGMGHVYETLNANPQDSDFLIWGNYEIANKRRTASESLAVTPEQLGLRLAQISGVM
jgi:phosphoglycerol transferase MdoB-like AlkP superfamily enzyme